MDYCQKCKSQLKKVGKYVRCPKCDTFCQHCGENVGFTLSNECPNCKRELNKGVIDKVAVTLVGGMIGSLIFAYIIHLGMTRIIWEMKNPILADDWIILLIIFVTVPFIPPPAKIWFPAGAANTNVYVVFATCNVSAGIAAVTEKIN